MKKIILKKDREKPLLYRHPWIFSGAIQKTESLSDGDISGVYTNSGNLIGYAYYNSVCDIAARMLCFGEQKPTEAFKQNIYNAIKLRKTLFDMDTNCYRLVNGEGDFLPGLVVDRYNNIFVLQSSTLGLDRLKNHVVDVLLDSFGKNITIYEKSANTSRKREKISNFEGFLYGKDHKTTCKENGIKFYVDVKDAQKTGLFLDMREMRNFIGRISEHKKVLNCFCYTGGFSLYAAKNKAIKIDSVDVSASAIESAKHNFKINKFEADNSNTYNFYAEDVLEFLSKRNLANYDLIILDPPAFAKKRSDIPNAKTAYYKLNKMVIEKMKPDAILLTCSCSYHICDKDFQDIISRVLFDTKKAAKLISKHIMSPDHVLHFSQDEFDYLKSITLVI